MNASNKKNKKFLKDRFNKYLNFFLITIGFDVYAKAGKIENNETNNLEYVVEDGEGRGQERLVEILIDKSVALVFPYLVRFALNLFVRVALKKINLGKAKKLYLDL